MNDELEETRYFITDLGKGVLEWAKKSAIDYWEEGEKSALNSLEDRIAILVEARLYGSKFGHEFNDFATTTVDNRALELAFLEGFLETRDKSLLKTGDKWVPKEGL